MTNTFTYYKHTRTSTLLLILLIATVSLNAMQKEKPEKCEQTDFHVAVLEKNKESKQNIATPLHEKRCWTKLHAAATASDWFTLKEILDNNADIDVNVGDENGDTPLMVIVKYQWSYNFTISYTKAVLLIDAGADLQAKNDSGRDFARVWRENGSGNWVGPVERYHYATRFLGESPIFPRKQPVAALKEQPEQQPESEENAQLDQEQEENKWD